MEEVCSVAKRAQPDPVITEKWVEKLSIVGERLELARKIVEALEARRDDYIRGAFSEGVVVGALKPVTGLSGSRIYQIKFALRDLGLEAITEVLSDAELLELVKSLEALLAESTASHLENQAV